MLIQQLEKEKDVEDKTRVWHAKKKKQKKQHHQLIHSYLKRSKASQ